MGMFPGVMLNGKNIGIVDVEELANGFLVCKCFGMNIYGYDPFLKNGLKK